MTRRSIAVLSLAITITLTGCSARPSSAPAPSTPAGQLAEILATEITFQQDAAFAEFAQSNAGALPHMLATLATDSSAPPLARANAVVRMGELRVIDFDVYAKTIIDEDPRVRGATLGVAGILSDTTPDAVLPLFARGLVDPEIGIQAKALQELRDLDLALLEFYIRQDRPEDLKDIARTTIRNAQAWGAPLTPAADGTLRRFTASGVEVVLRPDTAFPEFDQVIGTLSVVPPGGAARVLADSVEAVATVIPAVVDPAGRFVVVETARRLEVHDLETGTVRQIGAGLAPRPMPLSQDFLYFRPIGSRDIENGDMIRYELLRAHFDGGDAVPLAHLEVTARRDLRGFLSPLRWARIRDRGVAFVLQMEGYSLNLPSPFSGTTE